MKALTFHSYGGPEVLVVEDIPVPKPAEAQVLVKVAGAGVNPVDWKIREGLFKSFGPSTFPVVVGHELSGVVTGLGPGVTEFSIGDAVYGSALASMAEYALISVKTAAAAPSSIGLVDAGGIALAAQTAWQALFDQGNLQAGQRVLIHAAAGGVGSYAVQFAKWKGAHVIGTASAKNLELVKNLGADEVIDYTAADFSQVVHNVDLVVESIGGENAKKSLKVLKPGGTLVSLVGPVDEAADQGKLIKAFGMSPNADLLTRIASLIEQGKVTVLTGKIFPFDQAIEAQKEVQTGHSVGKIIVSL